MRFQFMAQPILEGEEVEFKREIDEPPQIVYANGTYHLVWLRRVDGKGK